MKYSSAFTLVHWTAVRDYGSFIFNHGTIPMNFIIPVETLNYAQDTTDSLECQRIAYDIEEAFATSRPGVFSLPLGQTVEFGRHRVLFTDRPFRPLAKELGKGDTILSGTRSDGSAELSRIGLRASITTLPYPHSWPGYITISDNVDPSNDSFDIAANLLIMSRYNTQPAKSVVLRPSTDCDLSNDSTEYDRLIAKLVNHMLSDCLADGSERLISIGSATDELYHKRLDVVKVAAHKLNHKLTNQGDFCQSEIRYVGPNEIEAMLYEPRFSGSNFRYEYACAVLVDTEGVNDFVMLVDAVNALGACSARVVITYRLPQHAKRNIAVQEFNRDACMDALESEIGPAYVLEDCTDIYEIRPLMHIAREYYQ